MPIFHQHLLQPGQGTRLRQPALALSEIMLHDILFAQGFEFLTKIRKNMKNRLMRWWDKLLLRKRTLIESITIN